MKQIPIPQKGSKFHLPTFNPLLCEPYSQASIIIWINPLIGGVKGSIVNSLIMFIFRTVLTFWKSYKGQEHFEARAGK